MDIKAILPKAALAVALVGAANWGLEAFLKINLVTMLAGSYATIVYGVVTAAAVYVAVTTKWN